MSDNPNRAGVDAAPSASAPVEGIAPVPPAEPKAELLDCPASGQASKMLPEGKWPPLSRREEGDVADVSLSEMPDFTSALDAGPDYCLRYACEYYRSAYNYYSEAYEWYLKRKKVPKWFSKAFQGFCIFFGVVGGMFPLLLAAKMLPIQSGSGASIDWGQAGYIAIAVSASLVLFDKIFGFSTEWMRCIETMQKLKVVATDYEARWARVNLERCCKIDGGNPDPKLVAEVASQMITVAANFKADIVKCIGAETQLWLDEFRKSLSTMEKQEGAGGTAAARSSTNAGAGSKH